MILQKLRKQNEKGFTLIELMIVIAIIGILAAIAIPNFISYRKRGYYAGANSDIKNAYTAAQAYFTDYPTEAVTQALLESYGYKSTTGVTLGFIGSGQTDLAIVATHGSADDRSYWVDSAGGISF